MNMLTKEQIENLKRLAKLHGRLHEPDCSMLCDMALLALSASSQGAKGPHMKEQIETPRVDAFDETNSGSAEVAYARMRSFARQLERELSSANAALEETIKSSDAVCDSYAKENQRLHDRAIAAEAALEEVRREKIELQKRLEHLAGGSS